MATMSLGGNRCWLKSNLSAQQKKTGSAELSSLPSLLRVIASIECSCGAFATGRIIRQPAGALAAQSG